jgi:lipopolysaccharide/colanic/teichoic acid biosynthesis glycosyltransferase
MSPLLALYFREAYILNAKGINIVLVYWALSLGGSLIAFLAFRLSDGVSRHFSVHDALDVVKAAVAAGLMSSVILFTFNRLEGIPRSTPVLQVLILAAGLLTARTVMMLLDEEDQLASSPDHSAVEHIIMIGSTRLSSLYIRFLRAYRAERYHFIAVLDHAHTLVGRAICGVPVVASPHDLEPVIEEFAIHGVPTDRVIIGGDENLLPKELLDDVRRICERRDIALDFVPKLVGLQPLPAAQNEVVEPLVQPQQRPEPTPTYYWVKRLIDFSVAFVFIVGLSPILVLSSLLVLLDVGSPVLFWQQRIGHRGRSFFLYKFRTLQTPYNGYGQPNPGVLRVSTIARMLRKTRIDELPQLFNVLVGDMSLIGPRPLLPQDQPTNAIDRLTVRPGITGWAQVHGGNLVTREEKGALDQWYIRHLSLWLDLHIALLTLRFVSTGERRSEDVLRAATSMGNAATQSRRRWNVCEDDVADSQAAALRPVGAVKRTSKTRSRVN